MNGQQVRDLARSLSQPERNVYARVQFERSDVYRQTALATLERSSDQNDKQHFLSFQRQLVEEKEVMLGEKGVAANAPAVVVGPTTRPAEATLSIKPAEAGLNRAESEVAGRLSTIAPNAAPKDYSFQATQQQVPAQQQGYFAIAPTTQPDSIRGARDLYTCVIVVQNNTTARAAISTTQPVAGKPTTSPAAAQPDSAK